MNQTTPKQRYTGNTLKNGSILSSLLVLVSLVLALPFLMFNIFSSIILFSSPLTRVVTRNHKNKTYSYYAFNHGFFKHAFLLSFILKGEMAWFGLPRDVEEHDCAKIDSKEKMGLVSLYGLHRKTGLAIGNIESVIRTQEQYTHLNKLALLIKYAFASLLYGSKTLSVMPAYSLFNIRINNVSMDTAVSLLLQEPKNEIAKTACFVNVNSFNLAHKNKELEDEINDADFVFADGSGVRVAAQRKGYRLLDNVNGTDLLPKLCQRASIERKRIYLLGAKPGVAEKAAMNLNSTYPSLQISGFHDGYFDHQDCSDVIRDINESHTDILLVAFGSPMQETFLKKNRYQLKVTSALAVGGLFDFYSGDISRAPVWMRELGMEWIWRLLQEPKAKFNRYVIGNPLFLIRCFSKI